MKTTNSKHNNEDKDLKRNASNTGAIKNNSEASVPKDKAGTGNYPITGRDDMEDELDLEDGKDLGYYPDRQDMEYNRSENS